MDKNLLRKRYKEIRKEIINKEEKSKIITNQIINSDIYINSKVIALYSSLPQEVNTNELIKKSLEDKKIVVLPKVIDKYKVAVFTTPLPSESGEKAMSLCESNSIPYFFPEGGKIYISTPELREYLVSKGVHCYNGDNNVIYCGGGYIGIHTSHEGQIEIKLPEKYKVKSLLGASLEELETDVVSLYMNKHETALFELI